MDGASMGQVPRCACCDDVIGVYEPVVVVEDGGARKTSYAAEPELAREEGKHYHDACYAAGQEP
jgi:hypothetical protein